MTLASPPQSNPGDEIKARSVNDPVNHIAAIINGNIDDTNISSVNGAKIADGSVTTAKIPDTAITNAKLATGAGQPGGSWSTWTPTFTNFTLGNGTISSTYTVIGKTVFFKLKVVFGNTSSYGTNPTFTLPVESINYDSTTRAPLGQIIYYDGNYQEGICTNRTSTTAGLDVKRGDGATVYYAGTSATAPFTWTTGRAFTIMGQYEVA